jgi:DNA replication and repair protein RecF
LVDGETTLLGKDVFLIGKNGQGKSNFLEALYFCSYASSFRGTKDKDIVRTGEKSCSAGVTLDNTLCRNVNVVFKDGKKTITLDGKRAEDRKEILSTTPAIIFCHEDMEFVAGTPERRRWFFDQTRSLWDTLYLEDLRRYRYALKSRNALFRCAPSGPETNALLDTLDPQLAKYGLELTAKRWKTAEEFSRIFEPLFKEISGITGIGVKYLPSWKEETLDKITTLLLERREADASLGFTFSGPHRDRYLFTRDGEDFSGKASTGQRRLLALLLRIAQASFFSEKTGKKPVLLLDDVLLELDGEKRKKFLTVMPEYEQAFYTFLPEEPYKIYKKPYTIVYFMKSGKITGETA